MPIHAVLGAGWPCVPEGAAGARNLHDAAGTTADYTGALRAALEPGAHVHGLDELFRLRPGGFGDLNRFVSALASIASMDELGLVHCHVDVFAYAFLKGAKNLDFVLPEGGGETSDFRDRLPGWRRQIAALEAFERDGTAFPAGLDLTATVYLEQRALLARPSARDERRTLANLMVSGPSLPAELCADLGIGGSLADRILAAFRRVGLVGAPRADGRSVVALDVIPMAVFFLRELMGQDYLASVTGEDA